jgi:hypothetical protein
MFLCVMLEQDYAPTILLIIHIALRIELFSHRQRMVSATIVSSNLFQARL